MATASTEVAEPPDDLRSFVTLSRTHPTDIGERHVFVKLDDAKVRLSFGETFTAELKPGAHHLRAHNTLMWKTLEFTLEYGAERLSFGRPIVSFQALKHRIADMYVRLEGAKAVTDALADAIDADAPDVATLAHVAKAYVGTHALDIVDDCVQITGGIGVTWEHDIHLYNRRAALDRAVFGTPEDHKVQLLEQLTRSGSQT